MRVLEMLRNLNKRRLISNPETDAARTGAPTLGSSPAASSPALPAPSAELARDLVYATSMPRTFDRIAVDLHLLLPGEAQLLRERASAEHRRIDDLAIEAGVLTAEEVEHIVNEQGFVVHANAASVGTAPYLAWIGALRRQGIFPKVRRVLPEELAKLREAATGDSQADDIDLRTLTQARELLLDAAALNASDLHLLFRENHAEVQVRIEGDLKTATGIALYADQGERLARAMYTGLATVKSTYKPLEFQDAQIAGDALPRSGVTSVRIIRGPSWPADSGGGFLVARLQYARLHRPDSARASAAEKRLALTEPKRPAGSFELERMGYTRQQVEKVVRLLYRPMGIVFVVGPTGCGKTTTLFEANMELARLFPGERLITIENPTEYPMDWALQLSTESERFGEMLRMALRMDPDTIMPGEIRGIDEARTALAAADTGHRVLATVHVTDPFETFTRLSTLKQGDLTLDELCNHRRVTGLIAQRLVPILCPQCSRPFEAAIEAYPRLVPNHMMKALNTWGELTRVRVRGMGCEHCRGRGTSGRRAVAEVVVTDEALMHDVKTFGVLEAARRYRARPNADKTMIEHAMDLVLAGQLDPSDAARIDEIPMREAVV